jgi:hypothetical protein
MLNAGLTTRG